MSTNQLIIINISMNCRRMYDIKKWSSDLIIELFDSGSKGEKLNSKQFFRICLIFQLTLTRFICLTVRRFLFLWFKTVRLILSSFFKCNLWSEKLHSKKRKYYLANTIQPTLLSRHNGFVLNMCNVHVYETSCALRIHTTSHLVIRLGNEFNANGTTIIMFIWLQAILPHNTDMNCINIYQLYAVWYVRYMKFPSHSLVHSTIGRHFTAQNAKNPLEWHNCICLHSFSTLADCAMVALR